MLSRYGLFEFHNPRWENTQMVSSLSYASVWLENEPCIVSYSDIFYDAEAIQLLGKALQILLLLMILTGKNYGKAV